ncbi:hypothetical protein FEM48_Zijuj05G0163100 [Ziziphus jujuba var. spinosa]|uniref:Protein kinase domain-containing protein n=1 Tax=Ziziphus jujuba var. spinosa TaxID=714518 RepID=A0A978VFU6_ZIZJJ|nr:hypothetical protein FEM48_Zijuj05G0163100 [Ziziphus jujuba var. spinosa]
MEVKIADFRVSKIMGSTLDVCNSFVGTRAYMSRERFDPDKYGNGDGKLRWICRRHMESGSNPNGAYMGHFPLLLPCQRPDWGALMCAICFGEVPRFTESVSDKFRSFVECCLDKASAKRWTASQLLAHPFLCRDSISHP